MLGRAISKLRGLVHLLGISNHSLTGDALSMRIIKGPESRAKTWEEFSYSPFYVLGNHSCAY